MAPDPLTLQQIKQSILHISAYIPPMLYAVKGGISEKYVPYLRDHKLSLALYTGAAIVIQELLASLFEYDFPFNYVPNTTNLLSTTLFTAASFGVVSTFVAAKNNINIEDVRHNIKINNKLYLKYTLIFVGTSTLVGPLSNSPLFNDVPCITYVRSFVRYLQNPVELVITTFPYALFLYLLGDTFLKRLGDNVTRWSYIRDGVKALCIGFAIGVNQLVSPDWQIEVGNTGRKYELGDFKAPGTKAICKALIIEGSPFVIKSNAPDDKSTASLVGNLVCETSARFLSQNLKDAHNAKQAKEQDKNEVTYSWGEITIRLSAFILFKIIVIDELGQAWNNLGFFSTLKRTTSFYKMSFEDMTMSELQVSQSNNIGIKALHATTKVLGIFVDQIIITMIFSFFSKIVSEIGDDMVSYVLKHRAIENIGKLFDYSNNDKQLKTILSVDIDPTIGQLDKDHVHDNLFFDNDNCLGHTSGYSLLQYLFSSDPEKQLEQCVDVL